MYNESRFLNEEPFDDKSSATADHGILNYIWPTENGSGSRNEAPVRTRMLNIQNVASNEILPQFVGEEPSVNVSEFPSYSTSSGTSKIQTHALPSSHKEKYQTIERGQPQSQSSSSGGKVVGSGGQSSVKNSSVFSNYSFLSKSKSSVPPPSTLKRKQPEQEEEKEKEEETMKDDDEEEEQEQEQQVEQQSKGGKQEREEKIKRMKTSETNKKMNQCVCYDLAGDKCKNQISSDLLMCDKCLVSIHHILHTNDNKLFVKNPRLHPSQKDKVVYVKNEIIAPLALCKVSDTTLRARCPDLSLSYNKGDKTTKGSFESVNTNKISPLIIPTSNSDEANVSMYTFSQDEGGHNVIICTRDIKNGEALKMKK